MEQPVTVSLVTCIKLINVLNTIFVVFLLGGW